MPAAQHWRCGPACSWPRCRHMWGLSAEAQSLRANVHERMRGESVDLCQGVWRRACITQREARFMRRLSSSCLPADSSTYSSLPLASCST